MDLQNLTVVVCTKNEGHVLEECLQNIKKEAPESEIIVVDADSTDNTVEIVRKYADKIVSDQKKGLSYARQLGIDSATHEFVAIVGVDNVVPRETFVALIRELKNDEKLAGVQPITQVYRPKNYWEWSTMQIFNLLLNNVGYVDVVGTPCIFKKGILSNIRYDTDITAGTDDTAVCLKLASAGYTLKRISAFAFEKQNLNFNKFFSRWKFYGIGDSQFYKKYSPQWTFVRKLKSLTHPLVKYGLKGSLKAMKKGNIALLPALFVAIYARYYGWLRSKVKSANI